MFVNLHQLETPEVTLRETKILINLLGNHTLLETLKATQNQLEIIVKIMLLTKTVVQEILEVTRDLPTALVVTQHHQEAVHHLPEAVQEIAVHQEALEDKLKANFKISF